MPHNEYLREATARGFVHQCTDVDALDHALNTTRVSAYAGFDCTGDSLHVGHLMQLMNLRLLQKHGHQPVVVVGGGTTRIGDPSGKDEARLMLTDAKIAENMAGIKRAFVKYVRFDAEPNPALPNPALMVNNADWLDGLSYIELLRDVGPHFSINRMLTFDSVKLRLDREQPLSFLEFNYMILQSYDFRELNRRHGVTLQLGGSDQWGNIVSGMELTRRTDGKQLFGLTSPLIATASGAKMGKTAKGAVWLNDDKLSPYDYWQFWRNCEDADAGRFLRLFTELPLDEIDRLAALAGSEINEAKKILATSATTLAHGRAAADQAAETARLAFEEGEAAEDLPSIAISMADLSVGIPIVRALVECGLAASNGEARRLIKDNGARVNTVTVSLESYVLTPADLIDGAIKLSKGKKQHRLLKVS